MRALMRIPEMELVLEPIFEASLRRVISETMKANGLGPISGLTAAQSSRQPTPDGLRTLFSSWEREVEKNLTPVMMAAFRRAAAYTLGRLPGELPAVFGPNVRDVRAGQWFTTVRNRLVGVGQTAWEEAAAALRHSLEAGEGTAKAAERVRESLGVTLRRASTIARTEAGAAVNGADASISAELAGAGLVHEKEWLATEDHRTRHTHADADGQRVPSDGKFTVGGVSMDHPHDPSAPPRETINCRCCFLLEVPEDDHPTVPGTGRGGALPPATTSSGHGFELLDKDAALAHLSDGSELGNKAAAKAKRVYRRGEHTVVVESKLADDAAEALLVDVGAVLDKAPKLTRPIQFKVPTGDPQFRARRNGGIVGGYVRRGVDTVHINPKVAAGELEALENLGNQLMPVVDVVKFRRYTIAHELGHIFDHLHDHTEKRPAGLTKQGVPFNHKPDADERMWAAQHYPKQSVYGRSSFHEGYAEAFAQWVLGGMKSSEVADAYAKRYGWR